MLDYTALIDTARKIARAKAYEFPGIEAEDIEQEIMAHVVSRKNAYAAVPSNSPAVRSTFDKVAAEYCMKERYRFTFFSAQYVYTPDEVRHILANGFFDPDARQALPTREGYEIGIESGGAITAIWDLDDAFKSLSQRDRDVIAKRYVHEEKLADADRMRLSRAVDAMVKHLNRKVVERESARDSHEGVGARRAITNAHALAKTKGVIDA